MTELDEVRIQLSEIDKKIKPLLDERFNLSIKVGNIKKKQNLQILDTNRQEQIISDIISSDIINKQEVVELYEYIFSISRKVQT